ncbi:hypothetical protein [Marinilactibacillus sp. Marseille-P9653]|uniref:sunset domain-containing protein n=1 Tax=Marinilactibacillus sp. Marseille-P9653 TaxID=2866583 RepID=UPI001CE458E4|nr:hypothetical protein [Marinilactibacillus sp. Marseille-P9653]
MKKLVVSIMTSALLLVGINWNTDSIVEAQTAPSIYTSQSAVSKVVKPKTVASSTKVATSSKTKEPMKVNYSTLMQSSGWQSKVNNGKTSGAVGKGKRLEAIKIELSNPEFKGGITYQTNVQSKGWLGWKSNGQVSGTQGESKRLEAIKVKLTGEMEKKYDVYYRVHSETFGWQGWAKNGEAAGTVGFGFRLEGIEVKLVKKGNKAPGTINNIFRDGNKKYVDAKGKGLIKGSNNKIYHIPNSQYYKATTKPKAMFTTEVQAIKAGYRPAK